MFRKQKSRNSEFICEDRRKYSLPSSSMAYSPSPTKARPLTQSVHDQDVLGMHLPWLSSTHVHINKTRRQSDEPLRFLLTVTRCRNFVIGPLVNCQEHLGP